MILQCSNNYIRTPLKLFEFTLPRKSEGVLERKIYTEDDLYVTGSKETLINRLLNPPQEQNHMTFQRIRQRILHHSPMCNDPACKNKIADFFHMIKHDASKELRAFWTGAEDPDPTPPPLPSTNNIVLGKEEEVITKHLELATEEHLKERKRNVNVWINQDKDLSWTDSWEVSLKKRGTLGYLPSDLYYKLSNHFKNVW